MKKHFIPTLILLAILFIFSCRKEKNDVAVVDYGSSSGLRTTITGIVLDESNAPLNGVTVSAYGQTTTTNPYGTFVLKNLNVNKDRCVLQFAKAGFFKRTHGFIASANTVNYVRIALVSNAVTHVFTSSGTALLTLNDGSSVVFPANCFVTANGTAYNGIVSFTLKHLSPDDANLGFTIPGGDLLGKDLNNKDIALYTYGMLGVELTGSSGEILQLATGTSATLTFSIASSQLSSAPASIPLWFFDETTSLWKEEGSATKVGNNYVGTVTHFSWWNVDLPSPIVIAKGKVVDCNRTPLQNMNVTVNGWITMLTNQNGDYIGVIPTATITSQIFSSNNGGIISDSQVETVSFTPVPGEQTILIPDLIVSCPARINGKLNSCNGSLTDGMVYSEYTGGTIFQATQNGIFSLPVQANSPVSFDATNFIYSYHLDTIAGTEGTVINLNSINLCDTVNLENYFILSRPGHADTLINMYPLTVNNTDDNDPNKMCTRLYWLGAVNKDSLKITFYDTVSGTYHWGLQPTMKFHGNTDLVNEGPVYLLGNNNSGLYGEVNVQVVPPGQYVKGTFSGTLWYSENGSNFDTATISGKFSVLRTD